MPFYSFDGVTPWHLPTVLRVFHQSICSRLCSVSVCSMYSHHVCVCSASLTACVYFVIFICSVIWDPSCAVISHMSYLWLSTIQLSPIHNITYLTWVDSLFRLAPTDGYHDYGLLVCLDTFDSHWIVVVITDLDHIRLGGTSMHFDEYTQSVDWLIVTHSLLLAVGCLYSEPGKSEFVENICC